MKFDRTKNSTRTFVFGIIYKLITILGPFVTRTIIIYKLGNEYLGLSSLFTSVLSILSISELGIGSAITFCLYQPVAENDEKQIKALLALLRKLYKYIGFIIIGIGIVMLPFLKYMISGDFPATANVYSLYILYLLNASASYLGFAYKGILLDVYQRGDVIHKIHSVAEIVKYCVQIAVLLIFSSYYLFVLVLLVTTVAITVCIGYVSKRMYPNLVPEGSVDNNTKKTIRQKVLYLSAHNIAAKFTTSIDNIVISGALGLLATGIYGNYSYISSSILGIILIAYNALTPSIGNSLCTESKTKNIELFDSLFFLSNWVAGWCATCLLCLYQPFIELWIGKSGLLDMVSVVMIAAYFYSNATRQMVGTFVSAAGLWNKTLGRQIVASACNLILDLLLVKKFGVAGIVFASFFTNAVIALPMDVWVAYRYILQKNISEGILKQLLYFFCSTIIAGLTYCLCKIVGIDGIFGLIIKLLICVIVPNVFFLMLSYRSRQYMYIKQRVKKLLIKNDRNDN